jgi:hypothetical protein
VTTGHRRLLVYGLRAARGRGGGVGQPLLSGCLSLGLEFGLLSDALLGVLGLEQGDPLREDCPSTTVCLELLLGG